MSLMTKKILRPRGKDLRLKSKRAMKHTTTVNAQGKWHSRTSLWAYKRLSRRRRLIADASRRRNRLS